MQLAEGEDLADRLQKEPIPVDEAIAIAKQIAGALESAHEHGIVHRDLKPSNIRIGEEGRVTILDFGLAKALETEESVEEFANSPTMIRAATNAGVILGTAAYMSPEQARGKRVDRRADIWAFGVVLWEMLTAKRLFGGDTVSDTLASVLKEQPDWSELPDDVPTSVRRVLRRCLVKNPHERMRDIGDARLDLDEVEVEEEIVPVRQKPAVLPWGIAAAAVIVAIGLLVWPNAGSPTRETLYFRLPLEPANHLSNDPSVTLSPDGETVIYRGVIDGSSVLLARKLTSQDVSVIPGSEGATRAAFSPDGASIVFGAQGSIWRQSLASGVPSVVAREYVSNGICWSASGSLVFNPAWATGLRRIPENGGEAAALTSADPGTSHIWPHCLPGGEHVLFTRWSGESADAISVHSVSLSSGAVKEIIRNAKAPRYHPAGILTFLRGETLMGVRFDPETFAMDGTPVTLISGVSHDLGNLGASYDVSADGTLVFVPASDKLAQQGFWLDLDGAELGRIDPGIREWGKPELSPDGSKLLVTERGPSFQLWIIDLEGGPRTQVTRRHDNGEGIWTPDGQHIVFTSNRNGRYQLLRQRIDGTTEPEILLSDYGSYPDPQDFTPDGRTLLFVDTGTESDLEMIEIDGNRKPERLKSSPAPWFRPDSRRMVATSHSRPRPRGASRCTSCHFRAPVLRGRSRPGEGALRYGARMGDSSTSSTAPGT